MRTTKFDFEIEGRYDTKRFKGVFDRFANVNDLLRELPKLPVQPEHNYFGEGPSCAHPSDDFEGFHEEDGDNGRADLTRYVQQGIRDKRVISNINASLRQIRRNAPVLQEMEDVGMQGEYVLIPEFLSGCPECMGRVDDEMVRGSVIRIFVDLGTPGDVTTSKRIDSGMTIARVITTLERMGYLVELSAGALSFYSNKGSGRPDTTKSGMFSIALKRPGQQLNMKRVLYPVVEPSFYRGIGFSLKSSLERRFMYNVVGMGYTSYYILNDRTMWAGAIREILGKDVCPLSLYELVEISDEETRYNKIVEYVRTCCAGVLL